MKKIVISALASVSLIVAGCGKPTGHRDGATSHVARNASSMERPLGTGRNSPMRDCIIGVSSSYAVGDRTNVATAVLEFILDDAPPGSIVRVINASDQVQVTSIAIPNGEMFERNRAARRSRMRNEVAALKNFFLKSQPVSENLAGTINLPRFLEFVAQTSNGQKPTVIVIASPFYVDPRNEGFNLKEAYCSDGHITADSQASVFSTKAKQSALDGVAVHYGYLNDCFVNSLHEEKTRRFFSLFVGAQKGVLATFLSDVNLVFERAKQGINTPCVEATIDLADNAVEMRSVRQQTPLIAMIDPPPKVANTPPAPPPIVIKETNIVQVPGPERTVYVDRPYPVPVPQPPPPPAPKLNIPWEGKGGEKLMRMSEESSKLKPQ